MEAVKRLNKLWTNDSLFLREVILVPVQRESSAEDNSGVISTGNGSQLSTDVSTELLSRQDIQTLQNSFKSIGVQNIDSQTLNEPTVNDFLNRVDTTVNKLKDNVVCLDRCTK